MKNILFSIVFVTSFLFSDIVASAPTPPLKPSHPIVKPKPIERPIEKNFNYRPVQYYNYNPYYYDNSKDIEQEKALAEKKKKIEDLEKELNATRKAEQKALQKKNRAQYEQAMKEFDNRKSSISSKNKIIITDEPIK